jgi:hypothetical protein
MEQSSSNNVRSASDRLVFCAPYVSLAVRDEGYRIRVKYFHEQEEGKWMQIRHEIALREELEAARSFEGGLEQPWPRVSSVMV